MRKERKCLLLFTSQVNCDYRIKHIHLHEEAGIGKEQVKERLGCIWSQQGLMKSSPGYLRKELEVISEPLAIIFKNLWSTGGPKETNSALS